jgi:hypothetical protein
MEIDFIGRYPYCRRCGLTLANIIEIKSQSTNPIATVAAPSAFRAIDMFDERTGLIEPWIGVRLMVAAFGLAL